MQQAPRARRSIVVMHSRVGVKFCPPGVSHLVKGEQAGCAAGRQACARAVVCWRSSSSAAAAAAAHLVATANPAHAPAFSYCTPAGSLLSVHLRSLSDLLARFTQPK